MQVKRSNQLKPINRHHSEFASVEPFQLADSPDFRSPDEVPSRVNRVHIRGFSQEFCNLSRVTEKRQHCDNARPRLGFGLLDRGLTCPQLMSG
jgi:hypothetical protein